MQLVLTSPSLAAPEQPALCYQVSDIAKVHATIKAGGAKEVLTPALSTPQPDFEVWTSYFRHPEGNLFLLLEERVRSAPRPETQRT